jgi:enoyl-[acyl-carrier protein] reductase II
LKNAFFEQVESAYANGATLEELKTLLGRGRAKKGMFEGDLESGELEIGQISARLDRIETASEIVSQMIEEYRTIAGDNPFFGF